MNDYNSFNQNSIINKQINYHDFFIGLFHKQFN